MSERERRRGEWIGRERWLMMMNLKEINLCRQVTEVLRTNKQRKCDSDSFSDSILVAKRRQKKKRGEMRWRKLSTIKADR